MSAVTEQKSCTKLLNKWCINYKPAPSCWTSDVSTCSELLNQWCTNLHLSTEPVMYQPAVNCWTSDVPTCTYLLNQWCTNLQWTAKPVMYQPAPNCCTSINLHPTAEPVMYQARMKTVMVFYCSKVAHTDNPGCLTVTNNNQHQTLRTPPTYFQMKDRRSLHPNVHKTKRVSSMSRNKLFDTTLVRCHVGFLRWLSTMPATAVSRANRYASSHPRPPLFSPQAQWDGGRHGAIGSAVLEWPPSVPEYHRQSTELSS